MNKIFNPDSRFMQVMNKFADIMLLNVITLLCYIPIITIGPATTAMHYVLLKLFRNESVILFFVRNHAAAAILHTVFQHYKVSAAFRSQRIQRTVAEQAVERIRINALVAGKVFTRPVGETGKVFPFPLCPVLFTHIICLQS